MYYKRLFALLFIKYLCHVLAFPERTDLNSPAHLSGVLTAIRRNGVDLDTFSRELHCRVDLAGIPGEYYYTSRGHEDVCVVYFLAAEDEIVEVEILEANFECDESTHVQWFDGWTMGTGSFPSSEDHHLSLDDRVRDMCPGEEEEEEEVGTTLRYRSNQNVAMMTFKLTSRGSSFRISLKAEKISEPCNVVAQNPSGIATISNYGGDRNCSFSVIYPTIINVIEMAIGQQRTEATLQCTDSDDYVQFLAGNDLDSAYMRQEAILCGAAGHVNSVESIASRAGVENVHNSELLEPSSTQEAAMFHSPACAHGLNIKLNCQNSVVRLVSGGSSSNSITIDYRQSFTRKNDCADPDYK